MNAATVAATIARAGVLVTLAPPAAGVMDVATGRVIARAGTTRRVRAVDYPDAAPDGRTTTNGTPSRRHRFLLAALDDTGAALPDVQGWTLTDAAGVTWALSAVDAYTKAGVTLALECRGTA